MTQHDCLGEASKAPDTVSALPASPPLFVPLPLLLPVTLFPAILVPPDKGVGPELGPEPGPVPEPVPELGPDPVPGGRG